MAKLGEEREHNLSELNQKRVQHVTTLQQMGKNFEFYFDIYKINWKAMKIDRYCVWILLIIIYSIVIMILIFQTDKSYQ